MKPGIYKTLKKKRNSSFENKIEIAEVKGYYFSIKNILFFVYEEEKCGWIVVVPEIGISFSGHFKTRSLAIEDAKMNFEGWLEIMHSEKYLKMVAFYQSFLEVPVGQISIYDYEGV